MKNIICIVTILLLFCGFSSFGLQENASMALQLQQPHYSKAQIDAFIREVYQDQADAMVF